MINVFWLPHDGVPAGCAVFRMEADTADYEVTCRAMLIFCLIRSMCFFLVFAKMSIASLFPNKAALQECTMVNSSSYLFDSWTISPPVVAQAESIFVLAIGTAKAVMLSVASQTPRIIIR